MNYQYKVTGLSCTGCKAHVENVLSNINGINSVQVNVENGTVEIDMTGKVTLKELQEELEKHGERYKIMDLNDPVIPVTKPKFESKLDGNTVYYCPMHCEGDKVYPKPGHCPVCGMDLVPMVSEKSDEESQIYLALRKKLITSALFTFPVFVIAMVGMIHNNPLTKILPVGVWNWLQLVFSIPVVFFAAWMIFERAWSSVIRKSPNMFTLIGLGAGVAWLFSLIALVFPDFLPEDFKHHDGTVFLYFEATCVILTLVLLGQMMEAKAHSKTNNAIRDLIKLKPKKAIKVIGSEEVEIDLGSVKIGDFLRVKPGDKIPVDGIITEGEGLIDESMLTGEPMPQHKVSGDKVTGGTLNNNRSFILKAERVGEETVLSQIIELVKNASRSRAPIQKFADRISAWFVPIVVGVSVVTFILWYFLGPDPSMVYALVNAVSVLIIACPCALGLATPMSVMVGIGRGAQNGVLIKNAEALEILGKIDVLVVDKTGTLTVGKPNVEGIFGPDDLEADLQTIQYVASLNSNSEHPLGEAILAYGKNLNIEILTVSDFQSITGKGVKGRVDGKEIIVGNEKMFIEKRIQLSSSFQDLVEKYSAQGKTVSLIAIDNTVKGVIVLADKLKENSLETLNSIISNGVEVLMLTGDNELTAKNIAAQLGGIKYHSSCLPEDKLKIIKELKAQGNIVAMTGDGVNDAPALALADIGIAMGTGTDVAIESASITLLKGNIEGVEHAIKLSKSVLKNIRQNLFFAMIYNILGVPIAGGILFPVFGLLLSPMIAALAMSFSSVSVITNSLRLRSVRLN